jgi:hypothetical protein
MYENPKLIEVGRAADVILGIITAGGDIDGQLVVFGFEFETDAEGD